MACGTPVITSNTSSLEEIAAGAAETVNPYSVHEITGAMLRLARDDAWRAELSARGLVRAQRFSWTRAAREMLGLYRRAAGVAVRHALPVQVSP
jgi:glycosyltransferase involved in cell wall biosynthesis